MCCVWISSDCVIAVLLWKIQDPVEPIMKMQVFFVLCSSLRVCLLMYVVTA